MLHHTRLRIMQFALAFAVALLVGNSAAAFPVGSNLFPIQGTQYAPATSVYFPVANTELVNLSLVASNPGNFPLPQLGQHFAVDSFFDVFTELIVGGGGGGGGGTANFDSFFDVTVRVDLNNAGPPAEMFDIELLSLSLTSANPLPGGPPPRLRESPTLASTGTFNILPLGGGLYDVDSILDVFVELSLDNGSTWEPASQPMTMTLVPVPEPASALLLGLGLASIALARRRMSKTRS